MTDTEIQERDEAIGEAIISGRSLRSVRREFGLTITEFDQVLERCFPLDVAGRMRMIRGDLAKLDRLISEFYQRSLAADDGISAAFATVAIKALERKHDLCGMNALQRIDLQVYQAQEQQPSDHERIRAAIMRVARGPDWKPNDGNGGRAAVSVLSNYVGDEVKPLSDKS